MPSASAALRPARPDAVARRSYLQRIAEPLRPGDPVLFAVPRPPPGEARAAVEMPPTPRPAAALHAPAHSHRAVARLAPATSPNAAHKPAPAEAAAESTLAPTENAAASGELPPASSSARTSLQPAPAPREPAPDMIAHARLVTIEPDALKVMRGDGPADLRVTAPAADLALLVYGRADLSTFGGIDGDPTLVERFARVFPRP